MSKEQLQLLRDPSVVPTTEVLEPVLFKATNTESLDDIYTLINYKKKIEGK